MTSLLLFILSIVLIPLYGAFFILSLILACLPIFPTRVAIQNLCTQMDLSRWQAWCLVVKLYLNYFYTLVEVIIFLPLGLVRLKNFNRICEQLGKPPFDQAVAFAAGHFGNLEVLAWSVALAMHKSGQRRVSTLAKATKFPFLTQLITRYRNYIGVSVLLNNQKSLFREMVKTLKQKEGLGFILDQKPQKGGLFVSFFKEPAAFPHHGFEFVLSMKVPVLFVGVRRIAPGYFECLCEEGYTDHLSESRPDSTVHIEPMMAKFARWLERIVRESPSQWSWDYKKWSRKKPQDDQNEM